jgi:hypothetical protein
VGSVPRITDDTPLAQIYNRVLTHVESYGSLLETAESISEGFELYAGVLWPEILAALSEELGGVIFAAGRPDDLHKVRGLKLLTRRADIIQHYTVTHTFISHLESLAPSPKTISAMRESPTYEQFERRWQLPVYFQLRWKEIVSNFEQVLGSPMYSNGEWTMDQSAGAWKALSSCWSDEVYIPELAPRFWRLSLQVSNHWGCADDRSLRGIGAG